MGKAEDLLAAINKSIVEGLKAGATETEQESSSNAQPAPEPQSPAPEPQGQTQTQANFNYGVGAGGAGMGAPTPQPMSTPNFTATSYESTGSPVEDDTPEYSDTEDYPDMEDSDDDPDNFGANDDEVDDEDYNDGGEGYYAGSQTAYPEPNFNDETPRYTSSAQGNYANSAQGTQNSPNPQHINYTPPPAGSTNIEDYLYCLQLCPEDAWIKYVTKVARGKMLLEGTDSYLEAMSNRSVETQGNYNRVCMETVEALMSKYANWQTGNVVQLDTLEAEMWAFFCASADPVVAEYQQVQFETQQHMAQAQAQAEAEARARAQAQQATYENVGYGQSPTYSGGGADLSSLLSPEMLAQMMADFDKEIEGTQGKPKSVEDYFSEVSRTPEAKQARSSVFTKPQPFEKETYEPDTSTFGGEKFRIQRVTDALNLKNSFHEKETPEETILDCKSFCDEIMEDIEKAFGGWSRISNMCVISDELTFNGYGYNKEIPPEVVAGLPYDLKNGVTSGKFAWAFDFRVLKRMKGLTLLKFDSADFVYGKVRVDFGIKYDFSPKHIFKACPSLQRLEIGGVMITAQDLAEHNDMFKRQSAAAEIYGKVVGAVGGFSRNRWLGVRDAFLDPDRSGISKAFGIVTNFVGASVSGAVAGTGKLGGVLVKAGKGIGNFINIVKENK